MIEKKILLPALSASLNRSIVGRLSLLDTLTWIDLSDETWCSARQLAQSVLSDIEEVYQIPDAISILAHVPLQSIRQKLRRVVLSEQSEQGRIGVLQLAQVRDPASLPALMREFRQTPSPEVAKALAGLPLENLNVRLEDISHGFTSSDDMTRFWTVIACARINNLALDNWEPLKQLWESFVWTKEVLKKQRKALLFPQSPQLFSDNPLRMLSELDSVQPLPERLRCLVIKLQQKDFDGWVPLKPSLTRDSLAIRAFVAGITGNRELLHSDLSITPESCKLIPPPDVFEWQPITLTPLIGTIIRKLVKSDTDVLTRQIYRDQLMKEYDGCNEPFSRMEGVVRKRPWVANLIDDSNIRGTTHHSSGSEHDLNEMTFGLPALDLDSTVADNNNPEPVVEARLHFVLQGKHVSGSYILANSDADLVFRFDIPPANVLAIAENTDLDAARHADIDIQLHVVARGAVSLVNGSTGTASFRGGSMLAPVVFPIRANASTEARSSLQVDFSVKGESVHQIEVPIHVVTNKADMDSSPLQLLHELTDPRILIEEALSAIKPPRQRIQLILQFNGGKFCVQLIDLIYGNTVFDETYISKTIERTHLETLIKTVHSELNQCYRDEEIWKQFDGSDPRLNNAKVITSALERTLETVAIAGARLNLDLRSDEEIKKALDYIEQNGRQDAVITVSTDDIFLPWEINYPGERTANMTQAQKNNNPVIRERFWGYRFAIETIQRGTGELGMLRYKQANCVPVVSLNLNPTINIPGLKIEDNKQPIAVQEAWAKRLDKQKFLSKLRKSCDEIRDALQNASDDATLIYVYCHGDSSNLLAGSDASLTLDDDCEMRPVDLHSGSQYKNAPIIFLNACKVGAVSPITFSSFLSQFRERKALGLISPTFSIPIMFGAHFGEEVVDSYLNRQGSFSAALLELRRKHLNYGNPVPLFYSLQCQF